MLAAPSSMGRKAVRCRSSQANAIGTRMECFQKIWMMVLLPKTRRCGLPAPPDPSGRVVADSWIWLCAAGNQVKLGGRCSICGLPYRYQTISLHKRCHTTADRARSSVCEPTPWITSVLPTTRGNQLSIIRDWSKQSLMEVISYQGWSHTERQSQLAGDLEISKSPSHMIAKRTVLLPKFWLA